MSFTPLRSNEVRIRLLSAAQASALWRYFALLTRSMPSKVALALILMVALALTDGISVLLLLPLLQLVGFSVQQGTTAGMTMSMSSVFTFLGIPVTLVSVLTVFVLVMTLYALLTRWQNNLSFEIQFKFQAQLRQQLYEAISNTNWLFFARHQASTFTHALTAEIERIGIGTQQLLLFTVSLLVALVYLGIAWQLSPVATGAVFVGGFVLLFVLRNKVSIARAKGRSVSVDTRALYGAITENLIGMKTVKSYGARKYNAALFSKLNERITRAYIDYVRNASDTRCVFDIGSVVILSIALVVLIDLLHLPSASALVMLFLFFRIIPRFSQGQQSYQYFANMLPSFVNVLDLQARCAAEVDPETDAEAGAAPRARIEFRRLSFAYEEERPVLDDVTLTIEPGQTTAIVGASGTGKSTVADLVMGLISPSHGSVLIDGRPLDPSWAHEWRKHIGYVAQDTFLFNDTVRANLLCAYPEGTEERLLEALQQAAAAEFVAKLPDGMDTLLGDRGIRLSGGERQRLALARGLLRRPSVLILDEATSNLDAENERRIQDAIEQLRSDATIIVITHRLSTIRKADRIYVLEDGCVVEAGDWTTLISNERGRFGELCKVQGVAYPTEDECPVPPE